MSRSATTASADERSPLLVGGTQTSKGRSPQEGHSVDGNGEPSQDHPALPTGENGSSQVKWTYAIFFLVSLSTSFIVPAMNKVEEAALLYRQPPPPSALKLESPGEIPRDVQDELGLLRGVQGILNSIVGGAAAFFLGALRSGILSLCVVRHFDRVNGTKKILMLALVGILIGRISMSLFCRFKLGTSFNAACCQGFTNLVHLL